MSAFRLLIFVIALFASVALARAAPVNVFAAASLAEALEEIARRYEPVSGDTLRFNLGASSALARQIKEGAPADVFFSADELKMDDLAAAGLIMPATRVSLLSNTLAIVVHAERGAAIARPADLVKVSRLALGETQTVPAGIYARAYLTRVGLWDALAAKVVPTENARACMAAVESGNVDAGIVYRTDALLSKKVRIAFEVPATDGPRISYALAVLQEARSPDAARKFAAYLATPEARAIFAKYGFLPVAR